MEQVQTGGQSVASTHVVVANQLGLHARPAGKIAKAAQDFACSIQLVHEEQEADATSILDILTLAAAEGCKLEIRAEGSDAQEALDRISQMFQEKFGEEK